MQTKPKVYVHCTIQNKTKSNAKTHTNTNQWNKKLLHTQKKEVKIPTQTAALVPTG